MLTDTSPHDGQLAGAHWTGTGALSSQPTPTLAWYSQRQQVPSRREIKVIPPRQSHNGRAYASGLALLVNGCVWVIGGPSIPLAKV